ncbi:MAG: MBL fold metallo-hydrolase [Firmicutes bacterium]|nr:MBL fold metallo-hydrolase [Bacillota bacterium]
MQICWHGAGCFSLKVNQMEWLVDPYFSRKADYGDWYTENEHAPDLTDYLTNHDPQFVIITHGHFDHFDLEAVKRINAAKRPVFVGNLEVIATLKNLFAITDTQVLPLEPGQKFNLGGIAGQTFQGVHWFTGEEGTKAAAKINRNPANYGAMPCGGPMLSFIFQLPEVSVYISGDTKLDGVPDEQVDVAIINVGGKVYDPATKGTAWPAISAEETVEAVERLLKPRVLVPIHYDFKLFLEPVPVELLTEGLKTTRVVLLPYNQWTDI